MAEIAFNVGLFCSGAFFGVALGIYLRSRQIKKAQRASVGRPGSLIQRHYVD